MTVEEAGEMEDSSVVNVEAAGGEGKGRKNEEEKEEMVTVKKVCCWPVSEGVVIFFVAVCRRAVSHR